VEQRINHQVQLSLDHKIIVALSIGRSVSLSYILLAMIIFAAIVFVSPLRWQGRYTPPRSEQIGDCPLKCVAIAGEIQSFSQDSRDS